MKKRKAPAKKTLGSLVKNALKKRARFLEIAKNHGTPCYVFDEKEVGEKLREFKAAFKKYIPRISVFYAVKTNHHPWMIQKAVKQGFNLDVSSERELQIALRAGTKKILFSGPGKSDRALDLAVRNHKKIIVNLDSQSEYRRLQKIAERRNAHIQAGVRIAVPGSEGWKKFGMEMSEIKNIWKKDGKNVTLCGIQFHVSFNKDAAPYAKMMRAFALYAKSYFTKEEKEQMKFIDFGGGFRPKDNEGYYSPDKQKYFITEALSLKEYAKGIGSAIQKYLNPLFPKAEYFTEPGRVLSNNSMHILLKVVDKKDPGRVVLDGGVNMVGWERYSYEYCPVINLTRPSKKEMRCVLYGSLCLSGEMDNWGEWIFAKNIEEGDILVIPNQGCLTYSLAQNFIHPVPPVWRLRE